MNDCAYDYDVAVECKKIKTKGVHMGSNGHVIVHVEVLFANMVS